MVSNIPTLDCCHQEVLNELINRGITKPTYFDYDTDVIEEVELLLEVVDPSENDNYAIKSAAKYMNAEIVELLMSDPRVDPSVNNNEIVKMSFTRGDVYIVELLLKDPRVSLEGWYSDYVW